MVYGGEARVENKTPHRYLPNLKAASRHEKRLATPEGPMLKMPLAQLEIRPVPKYIQTNVDPQKRVYIDYRPFNRGYVVAFQVLEE